MTPEQALEEAEQGQLRPVYLVAGEERFFVDQVLAALRRAALTGGVQGLNHDHFDASEGKPEEQLQRVLAAARTLPMMAPRRLVVLRNTEQLESKTAGKKGKKKPKGADDDAGARLDRLADYAAAPADSTVLVLHAPGLDKRRRLYTAARKAGWLVACDPLPRQALPGWVGARARSRSIRLQPGVAELLAEIGGSDLSSLDSALERVALFVGDGQPVSEDAVSECIAAVHATTVWQLFAAIGDRDLGDALTHLSRVYDPTSHGLPLMGMLAFSARQLIKYQGARAARASEQEAAVAAGAPPFKSRDLERQSRRFTQAELESWLSTIAALDLDLKGGSSRPSKAVLEAAVVKLCTGKS